MDEQEVAEYYPIPDAKYLRGELEDLQKDFRAFEQSIITNGQECYCIENPDPPKDPADNGCDCNPCNCPTDKHPCYKDSEFNKGDSSVKGLRTALQRLTRRARAMLAAQDGASCGCAGGAGAGAGAGTTSGTGTRTELVETSEGEVEIPREDDGSSLGGFGYDDEGLYDDDDDDE